MKVFIFIFFINAMFSQSISAQNNKVATAALLGAAVVGAVLSAEYLKELYEAEAFNYLVINHPELDNFTLKCLISKGTKASDQSGTNLIVFELISHSSDSDIRQVLLRFNNNNFMNDNGITVDVVKYKLIDVYEWNSVLSFFANLMTLGDTVITNDSLNNNEFLFPMSKSSYSINTGLTTYSRTRSLNISKLQFFKTKFSTSISSKEVFTLKSLNSDDYLISDYSEELKVYSNEKSMGFFINDIQLSVLLKPNMINKIHSFLNHQ